MRYPSERPFRWRFVCQQEEQESLLELSSEIASTLELIDGSARTWWTIYQRISGIFLESVKNEIAVILLHPAEMAQKWWSEHLL